MIAELNGKLIRIQVKTQAGDSIRLRFPAFTTGTSGYDGMVDWFALHSLHYGVTAFLKPEEAGVYPSLWFDGPKRPNKTIRLAKDFPLERVIKELVR